MPKPASYAALVFAMACTLLAGAIQLGYLAPQRTNELSSKAPFQIQTYPIGEVTVEEQSRYLKALEFCSPRNTPTNISTLLHLMMVFGPTLDVPTIGHEHKTIKEILFDYRNAQCLRPDFQAPIRRTRYGFRFAENRMLVESEGWMREAHVGQSLFLLALSGAHLDEEFITSSGIGTVGQLLDDLVATYSQTEEPEWTTAVIALYSRGPSWVNKFGETFSYSQVVEDLLESGIGDKGSACLGTHKLFLLALLLQIDSQHSILSVEQKSTIRVEIATAVDLLIKNQQPDGSWGTDWASPHTGKNSGPRQTRHAIWMTGHHLEWLALVPPEARIPQPRLRLAIDFVTDCTMHVTTTEIESEPCYWLHGIHAVTEFYKGTNR